MATSIHDDIFAPEIIADPFPYYALLRDHDPVHWNARYEVWLVSRYEHLVWFARHPELFSSENVKKDERPPFPAIDQGDEESFRFVRESRSHEFIRNDPPEHRRMRGVLNREFAPKAAEAWRPMVRSVISGILDQVTGQGWMDIRLDLAAPLPLLVISELLGIPEEERPLIRDQAARRMSSDISLAPNRMRISAEGIQESNNYLAPLLDERLEHSTEDLLSLLVSGEQKRNCSREETLANAQLLIDAGHWLPPLIGTPGHFQTRINST